MNDQAAVAEDTAKKTQIRPDLSRYVRDKSGSGKRTHRTDDFVARTFAGKSLDDVKAGAPHFGIDISRWEHLNNGQQRMLIGNAIRARLAANKDPITEQDVTNVYGEPVEPYDADKAAAEAAAKVEEGEGSEMDAEPSKPSRRRKK